jgi:hypothetical protein
LIHWNSQIDDFLVLLPLGNVRYKRLYLKMLKHRADIMKKLVRRMNDIHVAFSIYPYQEQSRTYNELATATGDSKYLLLKQQADANVEKGWINVSPGN